jgi:prepilin-type N-terminal cleavage/methylation domain-containing protein
MSRLVQKRLVRGFTLIELLLVLAIIAVLVGLLLPAIQKIRAEAARTQSRNNLKQMTLALQNCNYTYRKLPACSGWFPRQPPQGQYNMTPAQHGTLFYFLLPFLEQSNLYNSVKGMSQYSYGTVVKLFIAPGDPSMPANYLPDGRGGISYAANYFVFGDEAGDSMVPKAPDGGASIPDSIPDGVANTVAFAERLTNCVGLYPRTWGRDEPQSPYSPYVFVLGSLPGFDPKWSAQPCNPYGYDMFSSGIILVGLMDGSVRSVTRGISSQTWTSALLPDDRTPLGPDW